MSSFEGRAVLVTGGTRGIGKAIALRFAGLGAARIALGYLRNDSAAEDTAQAVRDAGAEPVLVRGNVASERVVREFASHGPWDAVVRYLAVELAPRDIRVNAVSASVVETEALEHFPNKEQMLASRERTPAGRLVAPKDVAAAVTFLCSEDAAMVRGHTLIVDG